VKRAGLIDLRRLGAKKWQAVARGSDDQKVFVLGPFPSEGAAVSAARLLGKADVGYQGGEYIAYASRASGLEGPSSMLAACLQAAVKHSYGF
jgi:hypothetical protein